MLTQVLTNIDWLSAGAGVALGALFYGAVSTRLRKKLHLQISEQQ